MPGTAFAPIQQPKVYSVLLANECAFVHEGLLALCKSNPRYKVMSRVFDGAEASRAITELLPDIAVIDLRLSTRSGLEVVQIAQQANLPTKAIVLAMDQDRQEVGACLCAGARAFLLESASSLEFLDAFREVAQGGIYISRELDLLDTLARRRALLRDSPPRRELQVLSLLTEGLGGKEIAARLGIRPATVSTLRSRLMRRLDIHSVAGLVQAAFDREGLWTEPGSTIPQVALGKSGSKHFGAAGGD
ncbi:MAG TPA: response regulator transcription factor [Bryobacteraceae bacterium]